MDKQLAKTIGDELMAAAKAIAARHGLTVEYRGGTFDASFFKPKIEFKAADAGRIDWDRFAPMFGFKAEHFGREFMINGRGYRIVGIRVTRTSKPVIVEGTDCANRGRQFVFMADAVKRALSLPS